MDKWEVASWEIRRKGGRLRFVVVHGVLGFGLPMAVFLPLGIYLFGLLDGTAQSLLANWVMFPIGLLAGAGFGYTMWHVNERRYHRALHARV